MDVISLMRRRLRRTKKRQTRIAMAKITPPTAPPNAGLTMGSSLVLEDYGPVDVGIGRVGALEAGVYFLPKTMSKSPVSQPAFGAVTVAPPDESRPMVLVISGGTQVVKLALNAAHFRPSLFALPKSSPCCPYIEGTSQSVLLVK